MLGALQGILDAGQEAWIAEAGKGVPSTKVAKQYGPVYHGTYREWSDKIQIDQYKIGKFFSSDPLVALSYGNNVHECYLTMNKPFIVDAKGAGYSGIKKPRAMKDWAVMDQVDTDNIAEFAYKHGYDGAIIKNVHELHHENLADDYIVFKSSQIKRGEIVEPEISPYTANKFEKQELQRRWEREYKKNNPDEFPEKKSSVKTAAQHNIEIEEEYGSAYGYVVDTKADNFWNMLDDYKVEDDPAILQVVQRYARVAVLKNINVNEDERGKGYGDYLLGEFFDQAALDGAGAIFLVADKAEEQAEGFNLQKWYEAFGFETLKQTVAGPLMVLEIEHTGKTAAATWDRVKEFKNGKMLFYKGSVTIQVTPDDGDYSVEVWLYDKQGKMRDGTSGHAHKTHYAKKFEGYDPDLSRIGYTMPPDDHAVIIPEAVWKDPNYPMHKVPFTSEQKEEAASKELAHYLANYPWNKNAAGDAWEQLKQDWRAGIVYHGTTVEIARIIEQDGFRGLEFGEIRDEVLGKYNTTVDQLSRKIQKMLDGLDRSYTNEYHLVSTAPGGEVATRWAGSGGEVARQIEGYVAGGWRDFRAKDSRVNGEPAVVVARIKNFAGSKHAERVEQVITGWERLMSEPSSVTGKVYSKDEATKDLWQSYINFLCKPEDLEYLGTLVRDDIEKLKQGPFVMTFKVGSHKTPPMSDTRYDSPDGYEGEGSYAYSMIPEFTEGTEEMPSLQELSPDLFKTGDWDAEEGQLFVERFKAMGVDVEIVGSVAKKGKGHDLDLLVKTPISQTELIKKTELMFEKPGAYIGMQRVDPQEAAKSKDKQFYRGWSVVLSFEAGMDKLDVWLTEDMELE